MFKEREKERKRGETGGEREDTERERYIYIQRERERERDREREGERERERERERGGGGENNMSTLIENDIRINGNGYWLQQVQRDRSYKWTLNLKYTWRVLMKPCHPGNKEISSQYSKESFFHRVEVNGNSL